MSRIAPLNPPYAPDIQGHFDRIMRGKPPLTLFRVLAGNARAWEKFRGGSLLDGRVLTLREREIVINRVCALTRCEYEWGVHVAAFAEAARLTDEQIAATVVLDADAVCWTLGERALISAVDALHRRSTLDDSEFTELAEHFDHAKIFEIFLLCGFYHTVAYVANGLAIPLEPVAARFPLV